MTRIPTTVRLPLPLLLLAFVAILWFVLPPNDGIRPSFPCSNPKFCRVERFVRSFYSPGQQFVVESECQRQSDRRRLGGILQRSLGPVLRWQRKIVSLKMMMIDDDDRCCYYSSSDPQTALETPDRLKVWKRVCRCWLCCVSFCWFFLSCCFLVCFAFLVTNAT